MSRKSPRNETSSVTSGIDWHDDKTPSLRKKRKKKSVPTPSQRLATMSELVRHLGQFSTRATMADIEKLQILARGQDIDIAALEI